MYRGDHFYTLAKKNKLWPQHKVVQFHAKAIDLVTLTVVPPHLNLLVGCLDVLGSCEDLLFGYRIFWLVAI